MKSSFSKAVALFVIFLYLVSFFQSLSSFINNCAFWHIYCPCYAYWLCTWRMCVIGNINSINTYNQNRAKVNNTLILLSTLKSTNQCHFAFQIGNYSMCHSTSIFHIFSAYYLQRSTSPLATLFPISHFLSYRFWHF